MYIFNHQKSLKGYFQTFLAFSALTMAAPAQQRPTVSQETTDQEKLQGAWEIVNVVFGGETFTSEQLSGNKLKVSGNQMTFSLPPPKAGFMPKKLKHDLVFQGDLLFALNASKNPKEIDLKDAKRSVKSVGIYRLVNDVLEICIAEPNNRPQDFKSPNGTTVLFISMKRLKK